MGVDDRQYLLERVDDAAVAQLYADGFSRLPLQQKILIWHLYQAALAGRDIFYDQRYAHNLEMREILEEIITHPSGVDAATLSEIQRYTKLFWLNTGPYNNHTSRKFVLGIPPQTFAAAVKSAVANGATIPTAGGESLDAMLARLEPMFFDPNVDPIVTNRNPGAGRDILTASANNLYAGVTMKEVAAFRERFALNSRLVKRDGKLVEEVYRVGGRYDREIRNIIKHLEAATQYATPAMAKALRTLIKFYQTEEGQVGLPFAVFPGAVYFVPDMFDEAGLKRLNHAMRDWRRDEEIKMDPELIDLIWKIHNQLGSKQPIHLISGYRSPETNAMLRKTRGGQATKSQHMLGKAADIHFPDVPVKSLRNSALIQEVGGVGYYPTSGIPFVHVDTDRVRMWPRIPRLELAALYPSGKTGYLPSDGKPITIEGTDGVGRREKIEFRYVRLDQQEKFIDPGKPLLLRAENQTTYDSGFYRDRIDGGLPERLIGGGRRRQGHGVVDGHTARRLHGRGGRRGRAARHRRDRRGPHPLRALRRRLRAAAGRRAPLEPGAPGPARQRVLRFQHTVPRPARPAAATRSSRRCKAR